MKKEKKIFFASDFHLGLKAGTDPSEREKRVVRWLKTIAPDASAIYLIGDIFDFWWEYKHVVPRGFTRFLGAVSEITDSGIPVHFFTGNHDMWITDYLSQECGLIIHTSPLIVNADEKSFYLAHGEGLGSNDPGYKVLLSIFRNKPLRVLYSALHPSIGMSLGHRWSLNSRLAKGIKRDFKGEDNEALIIHAKSVLKEKHIDYFIFGHRHIALQYHLKQGAEIIFLGEWMSGSSYAIWNGEDMELVIKDQP